MNPGLQRDLITAGLTVVVIALGTAIALGLYMIWPPLLFVGPALAPFLMVVVIHYRAGSERGPSGRRV